jgi:hypothetical protein
MESHLKSFLVLTQLPRLHLSTFDDEVCSTGGNACICNNLQLATVLSSCITPSTQTRLSYSNLPITLNSLLMVLKNIAFEILH